MSLPVLNKSIIRRLETLGVTHYSIAKNFDFPHQDKVSSVHFFTSDIPNSSGGLPEAAHFIPDLHIPDFGALTGFHETHRPNAIDTDVMPLPKSLRSDKIYRMSPNKATQLSANA
tara:strand:+ start:1235 stop:1579 length:345 start_codon:yes stop_codon:yes gene_type:complete